MSDRIYYILIVIGVISAVAAVIGIIQKLFVKKHVLEKRLNEADEEMEKFRQSSENSINQAIKTLKETDEMFNKTLGGMRTDFAELYSILNDTYSVTCSLYEEHKILIEYAKFCKKLDVGALSPELKEQLEDIISKHTKFLLEQQPSVKQSQDLSISHQSKDFEVTMQ